MRRVPQPHVKRRNESPRRRRQGRERIHSQLLQLLPVHVKHPLAIDVREKQVVKGGVLNDYRLKQVMFGGGGDEGAYDPNDA